MHRNKRKNEEIPYEAPNNRNKINEDVKQELAGTETFLTDTQGLRLAYENPDGIYQNGSILYIAGTKSGRDVYDDLKLPLYQTQQTKRYKDVDKFIKDGTIEVDGKKLTGITDIISHSLGSAVGQQINNDYGNIFRSRSYGSPFVSGREASRGSTERQRPEDVNDNNLRFRGSNDVVSMFDRGAITIPKGSLNPLDNHSYADIANVRNKAGNEPITREEFMEQFN